MVSKLIRWQTNGVYSHAALQLPSGEIIQAWHNPAKVRIRPTLKDWSNVEAFQVDGMTADQWDKAIAWSKAQIGKGYDFGGVFRFVTRWRKPQDEKWFCSELVFQALLEAGVPLLERVTSSQVSPTVLSFSPLLTPTIRN